MKIVIIVIFSLFLMSTINVYAEEDELILIEKQRIELEKRSEQVKNETDRLNILKKELSEDIIKYTKLLENIDKSLKEAEELGNKRLKHVAKAYEAMAAGDAASRLTGLDNETAVQILLMMNSKKAGLIIGNMESKKATILTKEITQLRK
ncbi:MAG: hypothetical protein ISR96_07545 [Nitrospira sp.]|nr:hypothetical protein [bacterium]MBL7049350.1 hypothetical protein [Nitrospira sp.]